MPAPIVLLLLALLTCPALGQSPPAGPAATLAAELVDLGWGVPGLRMYAGGDSGPASQSLLLADAGLLGLVFPESRRAFDDLVARAGRDRALIVLVTAVEPGSWDNGLTFSQHGLRAEVRYPFRLRILTGDPVRVGPDSPVIAVALLPDEFSLREPITVEWGDSTGTITFRH